MLNCIRSCLRYTFNQAPPRPHVQTNRDAYRRHWTSPQQTHPLQPQRNPQDSDAATTPHNTYQTFQIPSWLRLTTTTAEIAAEVAETKEVIANFFKKAEKDHLQNFSEIDTLFSEKCQISPWLTECATNEKFISEATLSLCLYFKESYSQALKNELKKTDVASIDRFFNTEIAPHIKQIEPANPWAYLYIHAAFNALKETTHIPDDQKKIIHGQFLAATQTRVLSTLTTQETYDSIYLQRALRGEGPPQLLHLLQEFIIGHENSAAASDSEIQQEFKRELFYLFIEKLFKVTKTEIFHFENFEFDKTSHGSFGIEGTH